MMLYDLPFHGADVMIKISEKPSGLWKCVEDGIDIFEWGYYLLLLQPYILH